MLFQFSAHRTGKSYVKRMDFSGSNVTQMTNEEDYEPSYSPDGKWIAYTGYGSGKKLLWRIPVSGGVPLQLSQVPVNGPVNDSYD